MGQRILQLLRVHDCCRGLTDEEIDQIVSCGDVVYADEGKLIHRANDRAGALFLVLHGHHVIGQGFVSGYEKASA